MGWVVALILGIVALLIFYKPIVRLIDRTKNVQIRDMVIDVEEKEKSFPVSEESSTKPESNEEPEQLPSEEKQNHWVDLVISALIADDLEEAKCVFKKHVNEIDDLEKSYRDKSFFLFLQFTHGNGSDVLNELEAHMNKATDARQKFDSLSWLSKGLAFDDQTERAKNLWLDFTKGLTDEELIVDAKIKLAQAYADNDELNKAKNTLVGALSIAINNEQKADIFVGLADVETKLGNKKEASYCLDKTTQYNPESESRLFNAAYQASESGLNDLSIVNYNVLTKRHPKNAGAWNNLGIATKQANFNIKAINSYSRAIELDDSLALTNQGYALLGAGFIEEASELAHKALTLQDPHVNVHKLISAIESKRETEHEKWREFLKKSTKKQNNYRKYIDSYYLGDKAELLGTWLNEDNIEVTLEGTNIDAQWTTYKDEEKTQVRANFHLTGTVTGSTIQGRFKKTYPNEKYSYLSSNVDVDFSCLGFVEKGVLFLFSTKDSDDSTVKFTKR